MEILLTMVAAFLSWVLLQSFFEWAIHKYILHGLGKNKNSFFHYHWEHHRRCRQNDNLDIEYRNYLLYGTKTKMIWKELGMLIALSIVIGIGGLFAAQHSLFLFLLSINSIMGIWLYFREHAWSHAFRVNAADHSWLPQHWMHHMSGKHQQNHSSGQNSWFIVTFPTYALYKMYKAAKNRLTSK